MYQFYHYKLDTFSLLIMADNIINFQMDIVISGLNMQASRAPPTTEKRGSSDSHSHTSGAAANGWGFLS